MKNKTDIPGKGICTAAAAIWCVNLIMSLFIYFNFLLTVLLCFVVWVLLLIDYLGFKEYIEQSKVPNKMTPGRIKSNMALAIFLLPPWYYDMRVKLTKVYEKELTDNAELPKYDTTVASKLTELKSLFDSGVICEEEFCAKKKELLEKM